MAGFIAAAAVGYAVLFAVPRIQGWLHQSVCFAGDFIDTVPAPFARLTILPTIFFAMALIASAVMWPDRMAVRLARAGEAVAVRRLGIDLGRAVRAPVFDARLVRGGCVAMVLILAVATVSSVWLFVPSSLCMNSGGVRYRAARFMPVRQFTWNDLDLINVACSEGHYGEHVTVTMTMQGGQSFRVPGDAYVRNIGSIAMALIGRSFRYDASGVMEGNCSAASMGLLTARP